MTDEGSDCEIVYITSTFEPEVGGTVRQIGNQGRALAERGFRITVLTKKTSRELRSVEHRDGIRVIRAVRLRGRVGELVAMLQWSAWLLRNRRDVGAVQVVLHAEYLMCAALTGLLRRSSVLWVGRGDADRTLASSGRAASRPVRLVRRVLVRRASNVVLTPGMACEVAHYSSRSPAIIPVPVDSHHFRPPTPPERQSARQQLGLTDADVMLLYTGHIEPRKGLHCLVAALARVPSEHVKLFIVGGQRLGKSTYLAELHANVAALTLGGRVTFVNYVPGVRNPFLWAADVFVLPSEQEGMPNAVLEAMACGLPAILPAAAGGHELLEPSFGVITADNRPDQLTNAIEMMRTSRPEWPRMRAASRVAAEGYSLAKITDAYEAEYRRIMLGRDGAR